MRPQVSSRQGYALKRRRPRLADALAALLGQFLLCALAVAGSAPLALRSLSVNDPPRAIAEGRALLDAGALNDAPAEERELVYWLGNAGLRLADDAVLTEMALRLESLAASRADPLAQAYAGFLRAERLFQLGKSQDGLAESMRAAAQIQDSDDRRTRAIAALELCDDYNMVGDAQAALGYCTRSSLAWRKLGDDFEVGRALNLEGHAHYAAKAWAPAAAAFEEARQRFIANGDRAFASSVGDNLAQVWIELGRAQDALKLSRQALDEELRSGRVANSLSSRDNIARALAKLDRLPEAQHEVTQGLEAARAHGMNSELKLLLRTQIAIAKAQDDFKRSAEALEELVALEERSHQLARTSALAELEARYAARERELRIGALEQENQQRELALQAAQGVAAEDSAKLQRQRLGLLTIAVVAIGLALISALLYQLWRMQRRKAEVLRVETLQDSLTGIENRRAFFRRVDSALAEPNSGAQADVLMIVDLDHFKRVNDRGGHLLGDQVLVEIAGCLGRTLNGRAYLARIGGEEFGVLGCGLGPAEGLRLAEQLRAAVSQLCFELDETELRLTISIGFAVYDRDRCHDISSWMGAADRALYSAKAHGRNRVVSAAVA